MLVFFSFRNHNSVHPRRHFDPNFDIEDERKLEIDSTQASNVVSPSLFYMTCSHF